MCRQWPAQVVTLWHTPHLLQEGAHDIWTHLVTKCKHFKKAFFKGSFLWWTVAHAVHRFSGGGGGVLFSVIPAGDPNGEGQNQPEFTGMLTCRHWVSYLWFLCKRIDFLIVQGEKSIHIHSLWIFQLILMVIAATKLKHTWKKTYDIPIQLIKKQRHDFANKGPYSQSCGFSSNHVQMW